MSAVTSHSVWGQSQERGEIPTRRGVREEEKKEEEELKAGASLADVGGGLGVDR